MSRRFCLISVLVPLTREGSWFGRRGERGLRGEVVRLNLMVTTLKKENCQRVKVVNY
jgi:hypothetical protein